MPISYDFKAPRLFVTDDLASDETVVPEKDQIHYLINVMRMKPGRPILLFNGRDGEWRAEVTDISRRTCSLTLVEQTRKQEPIGDIHYLFAPVKRARLDYMVQKATELGASVIQPVLTRHTHIERINLDRLKANVIEAAEQCGILAIPEVLPATKLDAILDNWDITRRLIFCDENAPVADPISALRQLSPGPLAVLLGPEGGFDDAERKRLLHQDFVKPIALGPRIMRADTAAIAALTLVQAVLGDFRK
ncbi:MAG: 16S rRNA (uracil(1498)-N(3))-methyltransferase [Fimbriimonadaceae bacterium]|nr:16S rRNA (uracil(1498)-N(3))-methyltransferase [Alphaproteobacteria bacterium]